MKMKKTIRKNFRFDEMDVFKIQCIRNRLHETGDSDSFVVRTCIGYVYEVFCRYNLTDFEQHVELCLAEKLGYVPDDLCEDSGAINPSPALSDSSAESVVERIPEFTDEDDELPF